MVPIVYELNGRKFVSNSDFLDTFTLSQSTRLDLEADLDILGDNMAELREHEPLVQGLVDRCLNISNARFAPVVTKEWVFWVPAGFHESMLSCLAQLYSDGKEKYCDYLLREGIGWQISSQATSVIYVGSKYVPTPDDEEIFKFFTVKVI